METPDSDTSDPACGPVISRRAAQVMQLQSLLEDADRTLGQSLQGLLGHTANHKEKLEAIANAGQGSKDLAANIDNAFRVANDALHFIADSLPKAASRFAELSQEMDTLMSQAKAIATVSEQAHLVALNAAATAERAGSVGTAFGIVADQAAALPERTRELSEHVVDTVINLRTKLTATATQVTACAEHCHRESQGTSNRLNSLTQEMREQNKRVAELTTQAEQARTTLEAGAASALRGLADFDKGSTFTTNLRNELSAKTEPGT